MTVLPDPPLEPAVPVPGPAASPRAGFARARLVPFAAGLVVMLLVVLVAGAFRTGPPPPTREEVARAIASALASQTPGPPASEVVYAAVRPSIVLIETEGTAADDTKTSGEGTGVVVTDSGEILTALHVVDGAASIHLTFADGSRASGTVTNRDAANDIAVVTPATPPAGIPPATLGNPGSLRIGSDAYIVGNPFGLYGSLSSGVVSGLDRSARNPETNVEQTGLIQVDAAVNPGNSGGPLLDGAGRVVGIVTALINPTDQRVFIGIGLVVPIDTAGGAAGLPPY
jgi:S1-C subfamily serine protease